MAYVPYTSNRNGLDLLDDLSLRTIDVRSFLRDGSIQDFIEPDYRSYTSGVSISSGSNTATVLGVTYLPQHIGMTMVIQGAGAGGAPLVSTIASISSGNPVLAAAAGTTVASAAGYTAFDYTTSLQRVIDTMKDTRAGGRIGLPSGDYLTGRLKLWLGTELVGDGSWVNNREWPSTTLWQAPNSNEDMLISAFDPNFGGSDNFLHAAAITNLALVGDKTTNKRGSGFNLYRLGENFLLDRVWALRFPRHGGRIYDFGAPPHVGKLSSFYNGTTVEPTSINTGTDTITSAAHGFVDGEMVFGWTTGTMPGGLTAWVPYYTRDTTTDTFKLAATSGGAAIDITTAGTGTFKVSIGFGLLFEPSQNSLNTVERVSSDNCHVAAVGVVNCFSTRLKVSSIKAERSATEGIGTPNVVMAVNLNGGTLSLGEINVYTDATGGNAIITNVNDPGSGGGSVEVLGGIAIRSGHTADYAFGYALPLSPQYNRTVAQVLNRVLVNRLEQSLMDSGGGTINEIEITNDFGGFQATGSSDAYPNIMRTNAINFGEGSQGGFRSSNSIYTGFPNWTQASQIYTFTVNTTTDVLTVAHPFAADQTLYVKSTGTLPAPLVADTPYYARDVVSGVSMKLAASVGGPAIDITTAGTGTLTLAVSFKGLFIREAPERFELRFGEATNTGGTDPGTGMFAARNSRIWMGRKAENVGGTQTVLIFDNETGGITQLGVRAGASQGAVDIAQFQNNAGTSLTAIKPNCDIETLAKIIMSALTASLPLKLNASKEITSAAIDLASAIETTGVVPTTRGGTGSNYANFAALVAAIETAINYANIPGLSTALAGKANTGAYVTGPASAGTAHTHGVTL
jgi:hypothetical protein